MSKLIDNQFGKVCLNWDANCEPMFIYTFVDDNGHTDNCEYAFVFKDNNICLYGWRSRSDVAFEYIGNWMDIGASPEAFHDHDYQDCLVGQLRMCLKEALNNIVGTTIEYL